MALAGHCLEFVGPDVTLRHVVGVDGHRIQIDGDLLAQPRHVVLVCNVRCGAKIGTVHLKSVTSCSIGSANMTWGNVICALWSESVKK